MSIITTHTFANSLLQVVSNNTCYLALLRGLPDKNGNGAQECSGGSYARQAITFTSPSNSLIQNTARIEFPLATASWGNVVAYGIYDLISGGDLLWAGSLGQTLPVAQGTKFAVALGGLKISLGLS